MSRAYQLLEEKQHVYAEQSLFDEQRHKWIIRLGTLLKSSTTCEDEKNKTDESKNVNTSTTNKQANKWRKCRQKTSTKTPILTPSRLNHRHSKERDYDKEKMTMAPLPSSSIRYHHPLGKNKIIDPSSTQNFTAMSHTIILEIK